jgi:hypothetical protein
LEKEREREGIEEGARVEKRKRQGGYWPKGHLPPWLESRAEGGSRAGGRPVRGARRRPVRGGVRWIGQNGEGAEGVLFLCSP